eukprot:2865021-Amphidinium_carterae.1
MSKVEPTRGKLPHEDGRKRPTQVPDVTSNILILQKHLSLMAQTTHNKFSMVLLAAVGQQRPQKRAIA